MMKKVFLLAYIFLPILTYSQEWQWAKHIGGSGIDYAIVSYIDNQHNLYMHGRYAIDIGVPQFNGWNCYLDQDTLYGRDASFIGKYNDNGDLLWVYNVSNPTNNSLYTNIIDLQVDSINNSLLILGEFLNSISLPGCNLSQSGYNYFLSKLDLNGNCIWSKSIGTGIGASSVTFDSVGNIYMAGTASSGFTIIDTCHFNGGTYISKFDSEGSCQWARTKIILGSPNFTISEIKYFNNNLLAFGNVNGSNNTLSIDSIRIYIPCTSCYGFGILSMDNNSNAKWLKIEGLPSSGTCSRSKIQNKQGDIICYLNTKDTCIFSNDTIITPGPGQIIVNYDKSGVMKRHNQLINAINPSDPDLYPNMGIYVLQDSSYYITSGLIGTAKLGNEYVTAYSPLDLFIAHFTYLGNCLGVDHVGGGYGTSIVVDETGVYTTGIFPPFPSNSGTLNIGNESFSSFGYQDIVLAKHNLLMGVLKSPEYNNSLIIYANPNKGSFRLIIPDDFLHKKSLTLTISNCSGKVIRNQTLNLDLEPLKIDIYGFISGSYYVTLSDGIKTYQGKMIVYQ